MKDRTVSEGHTSAPDAAKAVASRGTVDECRVRDEIEDDEVREALKLSHHRRPQTEPAGPKTSRD